MQKSYAHILGRTKKRITQELFTRDQRISARGVAAKRKGSVHFEIRRAS
jgi:hypothetical protein